MIIKKKKDYADECLIVDEKLNTDIARFFEVLKDFDEPLWDEDINHSKLLVIAQVFTIKSEHELSKASCDRIIE